MKLAPHWLPHHRDSSRDYSRFQSWDPPGVKIVWSGVPPYINELAPLLRQDVLWVIRDYPITENWNRRGFSSEAQAQEMARAHVQAYKVIADELRARYAIPWERMVFETMNEPMEHVGGGEPPSLLRRYLITFLQEAHKLGMRVGYGQWSVGRPDNLGEKDAAPHWLVYEDVVATAYPTDFLCLHEYWPLSGPQDGWLWWAGSYLQCPFNAPIMITEVGLNEAVRRGPPHLGWMGLPGTVDDRAAEYVNQLMWYEMRLQADPRIHSAYIFSYDISTSEWETFNIQNETFMAQFLPRLAQTVNPTWGDKRTTRWHDICQEFAQGQPFDAKLLAAIIAWENGGNILPFGVAGEVGLAQIFPKEKPGFSDRPTRQVLLNPRENVRTQAAILRYAYDSTYADGITHSLAHAVAAYNLGVTGLRNKTIYHPSAQLYLSRVAQTYESLWGLPLPGDIGEYLKARPDPEPVPTVSVKQKVVEGRWFSEEATRVLESSLPEIAKAISVLSPVLRATESPVIQGAMDNLQTASRRAQDARALLVDKAIPALYEAEKTLK